jgi:xanthosine utilization system XapX-like protein
METIIIYVLSFLTGLGVGFLFAKLMSKIKS